MKGLRNNYREVGSKIDRGYQKLNWKMLGRGEKLKAYLKKIVKLL